MTIVTSKPEYEEPDPRERPMEWLLAQIEEFERRHPRFSGIRKAPAETGGH